MRVLVPYDARNPKTRLDPLFSDTERRSFARTMLESVCRTLEATDRTPEILANRAIECDWPVTVDEQPLSDAVNTIIAESTESVAVVMADLALATPTALERLFDTDGQVVFAPGLGGGTNAMVVRDTSFRVDYHGTSISDHLAAARAIGLRPTVLDSFRLAIDIDGPQDCREALIHDADPAATWLRNAGFSLSVEAGEPTIVRGDRTTE